MLRVVDFSNDNVHGRVGLTEIERDIIRTATFRRLDRISQMGLGSIVFAGATHSRASHSLGVLAVAGKLSDRLGFDEGEAQMVRLAALLHDIGQYPLSHTIEQVYRQIGAPATGPEAIYREFPPSVEAATTMPLLARAAQPPGGVGYARDKDLAEFVITQREDLREVWLRHGYADDQLREIARMIRGQGATTLHRFVLDSEYDCDRLDYIQRDATAAGVRYGLIDLDYLIENMDRRRYPPTSSDEVLTVNRRKALHSFEHFLTGRYYMYSQIYYHRQIKALELIARAAFHALAEAGAVYRDFEELKSIVPTPEFLGFDDGYFWSHVRDSQASPDLHEVAQGLCRMATEHRQPHLVDEEVILVDVGQDLPGRLATKRALLLNNAILSLLCARAELPTEHVAVEELTVDFLPLAPTISITDVMAGRVNRDDIRMVPWLLDDEDDSVRFITDDPGSLLSHLAQLRLHILRLFTIDTREKSDNLRRELNLALRTA